jgi:hypothetical protein
MAFCMWDVDKYYLNFLPQSWIGIFVLGYLICLYFFKLLGHIIW